MASIDLGMVTAYAYAVAGGYTGSEQDFEDLLGNIASDLEEIENLSVTVTTLPEGSQATASYNNGVLSLGIPKGDTGATGAEGPEGPTGPTGNGIQSIAKTGTSGNVDTYTITYTNGQTTTFTVTNGSVTSVDGQTGDVDLSNKANIDGYYEDLTAGYAENLISNVYDEESVPYNFRTAGGSLDIGAFEYDEIVGGTVAWNQILNDFNGVWTTDNATFTKSSDTEGSFIASAQYGRLQAITPVVQNHVYFASADIKATSGNITFAFSASRYVSGNGAYQSTGLIYKNTNDSGNIYFPRVIDSRSSGWDEVFVKNIMVFDLTKMFGSTIADYIYTLETGQAGAGVAWFKRYFPKDYYPYNTGELMHVQTSGHKMVGFNQWDEEWEVGGINHSTGENISVSTVIRSKNYIPCLPSTAYYFANLRNAGSPYMHYYDADKRFLSYAEVTRNTVFTTPTNAHYIRFNMDTGYGTTYNHDICINLHWDGERDGEYEAYTAHTYPLDSDLVLRGVPKLDSANKLYYDGDTYEADGTVTRKYGIVDLGTLSYSLQTSGSVNSFQAPLTTAGAGSADNITEANIICSKYVKGSWNSVAGLSSYDKHIAEHSNGNYIRIQDSSYSDATSFKTAMSGVYLVYELATPTTETADTFTDPQQVSNWGTEEYIDTRSVPIPVGHNTKYPPDLKAKLETSPNPPDADGDYIVRQTNGVNEYVALSTNATIQNIISRLEALEG